MTLPAAEHPLVVRPDFSDDAVRDRICGEITRPEFPILVIDYFEPSILTLRVIPAEMWSVENNLSLGNMDFDDFASSADPEGVFRGSAN